MRFLEPTMLTCSATHIMLQWMGGTRRKVTTSRKSTHKRQKQYFEQRKRQQQTAGSEVYADETSMAGQHQKECRSLDILSLLNLSTVSDEGWQGKIDASTMKYHIPKDPTTIITNSVPTYSVKIKEAGAPPSSYQGELEYLKNDNRDLHGANNNPDLWNAATENQLSVLDMLSDDASEGSLDRSLVHEAHVAFSIEGLGKIRTETPLHSPMQESRISPDDCSLPWNVAKQLNSSKSYNYVLNDLELEVDAMMQDIDIPFGGNPSEFTMDITDSHEDWKPKLSTFADHMQLDSHYRNRKCSFGDADVLYNIRRENIWDARVSFLDDDFLHEMEDDVSWKYWPKKIDGYSGDFLDYEKGDMSDNAFEGHHLLRKRDVQATKLNSLEPPSSKHTSEVGHVLTTLRVRDTPIRRNYEDLPGQSDWHLFGTEDAKDTLSLLSEESCSSSAVRAETINSSPPSLMPGQSRSGNTFGRTRMKYNVDNVFAEEKHCKDRANLGQQSGKYMRTRVLPRSKATKPASSCFRGEIGPSQTRLHEEGFNSIDIDLSFSSSHCTSKANLPCVGSKLWAEDPIGAFPLPELDVKSCFNGPKHGEYFQYSPFGCFTSEKFAFCQPFNHTSSYDSPVFSNVGPRSVMCDLSPDSKIRGVPLDSSNTAGLNRETGIPELSVQGSINGDRKIKSKFRPADSERFEFGMDGSNPNNKDLEYEEGKEGTLKPTETLKTIYSPEHGVETSSSFKIYEKCERKSYNCDVEIPLPCQSETEEPIAGTENTEIEEGKSIFRGENSGEDSSKQVESYVEFVCTEKLVKETSGSAFP